MLPYMKTGCFAKGCAELCAGRDTKANVVFASEVKCEGSFLEDSREDRLLGIGFGLTAVHHFTSH